MAKQIPRTEFDKMPVADVIALLKEKCKINLKSNTSELIVRDIAQNKLHGILFINNDEEIKNDKIVKKIVKIIKNFEKCPTCLNITLIKQPFPKSTGLQGSKYCTTCGYLEKPKDTKETTTKKKESKQ